MKDEYLNKYIKRKQFPIITKHRHEYLTYHGLSDSSVYVLKEGVVKLSLILRDGREFNVSYLTPGNIVSLLRDEVTDSPPAPFNVRVESDSAELYEMNRILFWQDVHKDDKLQHVINEYYRKEVEDNIFKIRDFSMNGKKGAFYSVLLRFVTKFGQPLKTGILINFHVTNEELAGFCGISSRNSINRMISELKNRGVISLMDKKILIHDLDYLKANVTS